MAAENEQGRGFLEEAGCPWCPGDQYGTPHEPTCPVTIARALLAARKRAPIKRSRPPSGAILPT